MAIRIKTRFEYYILRVPNSTKDLDERAKAHNQLINTLLRLGLIP